MVSNANQTTLDSPINQGVGAAGVSSEFWLMPCEQELHL
jgi:hypothetical protein